jgi:hypothetical protein
MTEAINASYSLG